MVRTAAPFASMRSISALPIQPDTPPSSPTAPSTVSKAHRNLTPAARAPVNLEPRAAWVTQLCADFHRSLTAPVNESTSVFNIDAVPPSLARPIASPLSSKAGSPPRVLRSSTRAATPSPTKSAESTSSSATQSAGRKGRSRSPVKSSSALLPSVPEHES